MYSHGIFSKCWSWPEGQMSWSYVTMYYCSLQTHYRCWWKSELWELLLLNMAHLFCFHSEQIYMTENTNLLGRISTVTTYSLSRKYNPSSSILPARHPVIDSRTICFHGDIIFSCRRLKSPSSNCMWMDGSRLHTRLLIWRENNHERD